MARDIRSTIVQIEVREGETPVASDVLFWNEMLGDDIHPTTFLEDAEESIKRLELEKRRGRSR